MHDPSLRNPAYLALTDQQLLEIDALCDRFDQELVKGDAPRIETFLAEAPESARAGLLVELLAMEVEHRTKQGDVPQQEEYLQRFPQQQLVIASMFARDAATQFSGDRGAIRLPVNVPPVLANFRLIKELGRGGMGVVWLAEQDQPVKRRVALKLIKAELDSKDVIARFEAEKQALAMMDHPNIARVFDAGTTDDRRPYFVMELVDGVSITQYCDDNKLSVDERLKLFVQVCKAVQHAHQKGIIHRDLKPSNVLVTVIDGEAVPKVIDFGLAKAVEQDRLLTDMTMQTEFGKIVGTVQYMSPEQAELKGVNAQDIDTRTDVYSLGVILYELLTGSTPLDKETLGRNALLKILELIREEDPPRPSHRLSSSSGEVNSAVSDVRRLHPTRLHQLLRGELDWVVMKALEKNRVRRYQTANDLGQDLTNYLTGETVTARPPSTWYQVQKFARRNRGLVAAMFAIGLALLAGIMGTTYGLFKANEKTRQARDSEAIANFQLANARWAANRPFEARSLLHEIPVDYRDNFEWQFCNRHFLGSDLTCYGHTNQVRDVAYSPDGTNFASAGDETIRLWDATTGEEIRKLKGPKAEVTRISFSPDRSRLASGYDDNVIRIWDTKTGRVISELKGHTGKITDLTFSPGGEWLASSDFEAVVKIWDMRKNVEMTTLKGHNFTVMGIAFSPDGKLLATVAREIKLWDVGTGQEIASLPVEHANSIGYGLAFSPDGTSLAVANQLSVEIWNVRSREKLSKIIGHSDLINRVRFSPDGARLATSSRDGTIKLWDSKSGQELGTLKGHGSWVNSICFSPAGDRLASASHDNTAKLWDLRSYQEVPTLRGHDSSAFHVAFSPDGKRLASGGMDGTIKLWDVKSMSMLDSISVQSSQSKVFIFNVAFSPDGTRLAAGTSDGKIKLYDPDSGKELNTFSGHNEGVESVAFSPDGTRLASGSGDFTIKLWDPASGDEVATLAGHTNKVYCVAFSPDGGYLASTSADSTIRLWSVKSGDAIATLKGHSGPAYCVAFSPDGKRLASTGSDHKIILWEASTGKQISTLVRHGGPVNSVVFSPDGTRIASSTHATLRLWVVDSGREVLAGEGHEGYLGRIAFSPDGTLIATPGSDGTIKLWKSGHYEESILLNRHKENITKVSFGLQGKRIYSESQNEKLVWDVATRSVISDAKWDPPAEPVVLSSDGRWLVASQIDKVVLIDLEYKNSPDEKVYRAHKATFDSWWHQVQANDAVAKEDWYAAAFHFALLVKHPSDQSKFRDDLQTAYQKLVDQFEKDDRSLAAVLPAIVRESLGISRGTDGALRAPR
jgi:eukaryotic-like serine/threonine-protein kinase